MVLKGVQLQALCVLILKWQNYYIHVLKRAASLCRQVGNGQNLVATWLQCAAFVTYHLRCFCSPRMVSINSSSCPVFIRARNQDPQCPVRRFTFYLENILRRLLFIEIQQFINNLPFTVNTFWLNPLRSQLTMTAYKHISSPTTLEF